MSIESVEITKKDTRSSGLGKWNLWLNKFGVYVIVIILIVFGTFISPNFLTENNFMNIIQAVALLGIVAVGVSFITYSGHFADMSVPVIMAYAGIIAVGNLKYGIVVSLLSGMVAGTMIGLLNAVVIGKFKTNPIIWTLAVSFVLSGYIRWAYSGNQIYPDVSANGNPAGEIFVSLSRTYFWGKVPLIVLVMLVVVICGHFIITKTKFGLHLKLIGSNYEAARMTGVNSGFVVGLAFIVSAALSSLGGIFLASMAKVGAYYNGTGYDFNAVTAIVIGGMTLAGGRGSVIGVIGGVFTLGLLSNILTLLGVDTFSQSIVKGVIFILVVGINAKSLRKLGRDDA